MVKNAKDIWLSSVCTNPLLSRSSKKKAQVFVHGINMVLLKHRFQGP